MDRLNRLIGQLLTLARLESGVEVAQGEVCDLRARVQEVVADGNFEAQARQGAVMLVSAEACRVSGTTELLRSAIENVVRNAVRYTTAGTTTEVRVYGHDTPAGHHAVIEVRDYRPGVPEVELAHLFQPFYRLTQARAPQPDGAGLAITERVVQRHGGTLAAANAPGGGLRVTIRLPFHGPLPSPKHGGFPWAATCIGSTLHRRKHSLVASLEKDMAGAQRCTPIGSRQGKITALAIAFIVTAKICE